MRKQWDSVKVFLFRHKRVIIISFLSIVALAAIGLTGSWFYYDVYRPHHLTKIKQKGIDNPKEAIDIAEYLVKNHSQQDAIDVITNAAELGYSTSQFLLAEYYNGKTILNSLRINKKDYEVSAYWALKSAKRGNAKAKAMLGIYYLLGEGVDQDFIKSIKWLKEGAEGGSSRAQYYLGCLYENGLYYVYNHTDGRWYWNIGSIKEKRGKRLHKGDPIYLLKGSTDYLGHEELSLARWGRRQIYLEKDITLAKYYWKLASDNGYEQAAEKLHKVYEGDDK